MAHRIREAMRDLNPEPMGGSGKIVESDETYIGTAEGSIDFGLNRVAATNLLETLQLFLSDWPTGSQAS